MTERNVIIYRNFSTPKGPGPHHRLLCLTGNKKGEVYYLVGDRLVMGRGEETDIQVLDMKSSREHAEIKKLGGEYIITDLGSQNGVIVNDLRVTQYTLKEGDRIVIGQTVYKYGIVNGQEEKKGATEAPAESQDPFADDESSKDAEAAPAKKPNKKVLLILVLAVGGYLLIDDTPPEQKKKEGGNPANRAKDVTAELDGAARKRRSQEDKELEEKLKVIFQRGLREAREGNYFRAISEFNLALILSPQNARASFYLNRTMQILKEEIEQNFIQASRYQDALRYDAAISSYCAIIRLLQNFPNDDRYTMALDKIKELEKTLGMEEGEIKCLQE